MAYDSGFSRRSSSERDLQPVAIVSVDPTSRVAVGATRTRHTIRINCAYATGDTITTPAVGEQWYVERFDNEWRLYGRIPFNDATLNIEPEAGQVSVGSANGPLELNGSEIRINNVMRLGEVYYRDTGSGFERSTDKKTWTAIAGGAAGVVQIIAEALAHYTGTDQTLAVAALKTWGGGIDDVVANFNTVWNLLCGNVFIGGLKRLGLGTTDVEKIIDGFQNFMNYLFGVVFCDFTGDVDPQTILARLRDLLAPIINNPFIQGLAAVATALGVAGGSLLQNIVTGLTSLLELMFNILTCRWDSIDLAGLTAVTELFTPDGPFSPASIVNFLKTVIIDPIINLEDQVLTPIIGNFLNGLKEIANLITGTLTGQTFDSLAEGVVTGVRDLVQLFYDTVTDILSGTFPTRIADILNINALIVADFPFSPANLVKSVTDFFILLFSRTLDAEGTVNPVGAIFNGLADAWKAVAALFGFDDAGSVFKNSLYGISEFVSILHDLFLVNPFDEGSRTMFTSAIGKITAIVADADPSSLIINILNVVGRVFQAIIDNPIAQIIREFLTLFGIQVTNEDLFTQIFQGFESAFNTVMKIITEVLIPLGHDNWQTLIPFIPATVWDGIWNATLPEFPVPDFLTTISDLLAGAGSAITDLITRIFEVFGINLDPRDENGDPIPFDPVVAATDFILKIFSGETLTTFMTAAFGGVFGTTVTEITRFFTRVVNLFGLDLTDFTSINPFNFVSAAAGFITNVLVNAPSTAVAVLQGIVETITSLAYKVAEAVITGLRGFPFGLLNGVADFLQGLLDNFAGGQRGYVNSGTNLLIDAGAEKQYLWKNRQTSASYQTGVTWSAAPKRSGGGSLQVSGGNVVWMNINDLGEVSPIRTAPDEYLHMEAYVFSYYSTTVYLYAKAENSLDGTNATYYLTAFNVGPTSSGWTKVQSDIQIPSPWDRVSFGVYAAGYPIYVDDMLVREITAAQTVKGKVSTLNYALYQSYVEPTPGTTPKINVNVVPSGIPATSITSPSGSGTIATDIGVAAYGTGLAGAVNGPGGLVGTVGNAANGTGLAGTVSGPGGLVTQVGSTTYGTGLNGAVYGTNGQGGLIGVGGTKDTVTTTYNGVYGTGGLVKSLYGSTATAPQTKIAATALPTTVGAVGSGLLYRRWSSEGATVTTASYTGVQLPYGFYGHPDVGNTSDLIYENNGGYMQIRATLEGWYQVDMAFGLSKALIMYQWYFNPVLYKNGSVYKYGNGAANAAYYGYATALGLVTGVTSYSLCPEMVQSSFIVYLKVNETVAPGYIWHPDGSDQRGSGTSSATIITTDANGYYTYFSIGLLNRSLA